MGTESVVPEPPEPPPVDNGVDGRRDGGEDDVDEEIAALGVVAGHESTPSHTQGEHYRKHDEATQPEL